MSNLTINELRDFYDEFIKKTKSQGFLSAQQIHKEIEQRTLASAEMGKGILGFFKSKKEINHKSINAYNLLSNSTNVIWGAYKDPIDIKIIFTGDGFIYLKEIENIENPSQLKANYAIEELCSIDIEEMDYDENGKPLGYYIELSNWETPSVVVDEEDLIEIKNFGISLSRRIEEKRQSTLENKRSSIIQEIKVTENGSIEIESPESFENLLRQNQEKIISIDKKYIHDLVKTGKFLKTKLENTQKCHDIIKKVSNISELNEIYELLKEEKYKYDLVLYHSLAMISSLMDGDMITFYDIYELFDKFGIFESQWEKDMSGKLDQLGGKIDQVNENLIRMEKTLGTILLDILKQTQKMEASMLNAIGNLTYVTGTGLKSINDSVNTKLTAINSTLRVNNLVSGIQAYQTYKLTHR